MITQKQAEEIVKRYSPTTRVIVSDSDSMDGIYLQKTNTISIAHNWSVAGLLHEITHAVLILEDGRAGHDGVFADRFTKIVDDYYGKQIERLQKDNEYMVKRCNYLEKENARLNYQRDMFRHGLVEISELSEKQLNDGTAWDIARYCISSYKAPNNADIFMDELSKKIARLQEQLDIVTEQRNDIHIDKQVLQKQLNEANVILKSYANRDNWSSIMDGCGYSDNALYVDDRGYSSAENYLKKWGVK